MNGKINKILRTLKRLQRNNPNVMYKGTMPPTSVFNGGKPAVGDIGELESRIKKLERKLYGQDKEDRGST